MPKNKFEPWMRLWSDQGIFWSRVSKDAPEKCWLWLGGKTSDGYGTMTVAGQQVLAHRAAFFLGNGHLFIQDLICHRCDNPACCNPGHLFAGSQADNMRDMRLKGRRKGRGVGEANGRARLTAAAAAAIRAERASGDSLKMLAHRYGVGLSTISRVCRGESWT